MTSRDFCFWLQGFFELNGQASGARLTVEQTDLVKRHLALVFKHEIDPSMGGDQAALQEVHDGKPQVAQEQGPEPHGHGDSIWNTVYRC